MGMTQTPEGEMLISALVSPILVPLPLQTQDEFFTTNLQKHEGRLAVMKTAFAAQR